MSHTTYDDQGASQEGAGVVFSTPKQENTYLELNAELFGQLWPNITIVAPVFMHEGNPCVCRPRGFANLEAIKGFIAGVLASKSLFYLHSIQKQEWEDNGTSRVRFSMVYRIVHP